MPILCPCKSAKNFTHCCQAIIQGKQTATTAEQLMRSRYTAFVLGDSNYLLSSWHSDYKPKSVVLDSSTHWLNLEIIASSNGFVHFKAYSLLGDQISILEEKSNFEKVNNQWFYTKGELIPAKSYKMSRNTSCICGSGKKFKRCCYQL
jgi:SEC-C motif-containing protein